MSTIRDIPWFNPRQMDETTVLALSTGREKLLGEFFRSVLERMESAAPGPHWLVTGSRGAGKSFFLRLVQASFRRAVGDGATFVLLPEELPNAYSPSEWVAEVARMMPGKRGNHGRSPAWKTADDGAAWDAALAALLDSCPAGLLVIGVENFDQLLDAAFSDDVRAARLRKLMENEPRIMLLATAVEGEFDEDYARRLFRQFEHHPMPRWDQHDHRHYLQRRAGLQGRKPTPNQLARIDAYSRFTGGSARVAAVMAATILDEDDPLHASHNLTTTLDRMSDYYRSLHEKMPANTRKVFDALVRGGEPASQVEVARRIAAEQKDISRAFGWLVDYGYVVNEREPGSKESRYRVSDRLFVQFYRMRYINPDQPSQLAILADLLAATLEFGQKWAFAEGYAARLENEAGAFSLAREILTGIAAQPQHESTSAIRALWINMIDTGVPLRLLRDLLDELPTIFEAQLATVGPLATVLRAWLDDLAREPGERAAHRRSHDPDMATTLHSLAGSLGPEARERYRLDPGDAVETAPKIESKI